MDALHSWEYPTSSLHFDFCILTFSEIATPSARNDNLRERNDTRECHCEQH